MRRGLRAALRRPPGAPSPATLLPRAAGREGAREALPAPGLGRRGFAAASSASSETAFGILSSLQRAGGDDVDGQVLSAAGGLLRCELPGPVAIGRIVEAGDAMGVVLRFDDKMALVAQISGRTPAAGAAAKLGGKLGLLQIRGAGETGVTFAAAADVVGADGVASLLELPRPSNPATRRPVSQRLPSGLAAVEALQPLGEGQRVGFVGLPGLGKSAAARMLLRSQAADTVCVYAALQPLAKLQGQFGAAADFGRLVVVHADPQRDTLGACYLAPLAALHLATQLRKQHRHVLLVLDDLCTFAELAPQLSGGRNATPPLAAPHVVAAALEAGGALSGGGALSVAVVLDCEHEEDMSMVVRDLFRGADNSLDVKVPFSAELAKDGIMPAINPDVLSVGPGPRFQEPLFRRLRGELRLLLQKSGKLSEKLDLGKQLGLHAEPDEEEDLASAKVSRALLSHAVARPLPELAVLLCASIVYHFPQPRVTQTAVAQFQEGVIATIRDEHPVLWAELCAAQEGTSDSDELSLRNSDSDAAGLLQAVGEALLAHRFDFHLTRPVA